MNTIEIPELPGVGRLGRNIQHDPRSWEFPASMSATIQSVQHTRHAPVFNQGPIGSCTGNAVAGMLMTEPFFRPGRQLDEHDAIGLYELATHLDRVRGIYPPDDTGSTGLAALKAAKKVGYLSSYRHAFGLKSALRALTLAPVIIGIPWYASFDHPRSDGLIKLVEASGIRGGHEVVVDGLNAEDKSVGITNSWGADWGDNGRCYLSWDDFDALLHQSGDVSTAVA